MDNSKWPAKAVLPIAMPGVKYVVASVLVTGILFYSGFLKTGILALLITLFITWFFRDPERRVPEGADLLVSPADGKVIVVEYNAQCEYMDDPCQKVSIFMNVFNVHVNRIPFSGIVEKVQYHPGTFVNASFDKASVHNERNALVIKTDNDSRYVCVQIAGFIARRIVNCVKIREHVHKGDRYGMIQFGSRLDLYLPMGFEILVRPGDKTSAGSSVIGRMC
ncbi:phosphatidylserine decarboxylase family protein [Desulfobacter latus]|uniref:Phosphatidylserine decarboxylase proenzyme n=1 Tax=Desulfobacter latus TaxID=2292 RepID=A0A850TF00_9BACT|nr:phosphatidylserine decarboxylase family protein [Desulfobacter latus]NWH06016.1 phosphatidylserine decarboxylase family protein [Desulfobacter latus]